MTTERRAAITSNVKDFVVPLATVMTLIASAFHFGGVLEGMRKDIAQQAESMQKLEAAFSPMERARIDATFSARLDRAEEREKELAVSFKLLEDYVKGRISNLPYRGE